MPSCLGVYIENNIIKYAKVVRDNNTFKVESFGMKFYDKLNETISQIIAETYSYKIPIITNLSDEFYSYFYMFSLLNKNDLQKAIATEFESLCYDKGYNVDALEKRFIIVDNKVENEKVKVIHVAANKTEIARKIQQLEGHKIREIVPLGMAISNLVDISKKENFAIVNIEYKTTVTIVLNKKIVDVQVLDEGTEEILRKINLKENSYTKAYEICKNTTIYTNEGQELQDDSETEYNAYLEYIMPTLYTIVGKIRKIVNESEEKIDKVYITGTASAINNIDLYFQDYLKNIECTILKPYFIGKLGKKINIKDYIEVNSAIALGMQGVGEGLKNINFKKSSIADKLPEWLSLDVGNLNLKNINLKAPPLDFKSSLDAVERNMMRTISAILITVIAYSSFSIITKKQIDNKSQEIQDATTETNKQINLAQTDSSRLQTITSKYETKIQNINDINSKKANKSQNRNAIPNLLNQIMAIIPKNVQITSIENASGTKVVINAQAEKYEQLGYFKAKIKTQTILTNVTSTSGVKQDNLVKITIEGDLP